MKFCPNCGEKLEKGAKFCAKCGKATSEEVAKSNPTNLDGGRKFMAVLSYWGLLVLIPKFAAKDDEYAQYHATQGMNFLLVWAGWIVLTIILSFIKVEQTYWYITVKVTPWWAGLISWLIGLGVATFSIIGTVYAASGKEKELPLIGKIKVFK